MLSRRECGRCHRDVLVAIGAETPEDMSAVQERIAASAGGGARLEPTGFGDPQTLVRGCRAISSAIRSRSRCGEHSPCHGHLTSASSA